MFGYVPYLGYVCSEGTVVAMTSVGAFDDDFL